MFKMMYWLLINFQNIVLCIMYIMFTVTFKFIVEFYLIKLSSFIILHLSFSEYFTCSSTSALLRWLDLWWLHGNGSKLYRNIYHVNNMFNIIFRIWQWNISMTCDARRRKTRPWSARFARRRPSRQLQRFYITTEVMLVSSVLMTVTVMIQMF